MQYGVDLGEFVQMIDPIGQFCILPQYHVIYDDLFTTVPNAESGGIFHDTPLMQDHWEQIVTSSHERIVALDDLNLHPCGDLRHHQPSLHNDWLTLREAQHRANVREQHHHMPLSPTTMAPEGGTTVWVGNGGAVPSPRAAIDVTFYFLLPESTNNDDLSLVDDGSVPKQNAQFPPTITIPLPN